MAKSKKPLPEAVEPFPEEPTLLAQVVTTVPGYSAVVTGITYSAPCVVCGTKVNAGETCSVDGFVAAITIIVAPE